MSQLFVSAVKSYDKVEDFWLTHSSAIGEDEDGPRKNWSWTRVIKALRLQRKEINDIDTRTAKIAFHGRNAEWETEFSYRKGSKMVPLKKDAEIARRFRAIESRPSFWDYVEDDGGENTDEDVEA